LKLKYYLIFPLYVKKTFLLSLFENVYFWMTISVSLGCRTIREGEKDRKELHYITLRMSSKDIKEL
jgi:guanylate kinase